MATKSHEKPGFESLTHAPELHQLNVEHSFPLVWSQAAPKSFIARLFQPLLRRLRRAIMGDYFEREQQYFANLVRHLNKLTEAIESSNGSAQASHELRTGVESLKNELRKHELQLSTLDSVSRGVERIVSRLTATPPAPGSSETKPIDYSYLLLENRYRGSEEEIGKRLALYPPIFSGAAKPVLEIGAGRGELQQLFKDADIKSYGLDLDAAMVERSREQNLDVRLENGLTHLEQLAPQSLGGLIAVQVIEHLSYEQLKTLFSLCTTRIARGGKVVFETINASSMVALTKNYFRDPTHTFPLHPETTRFLMELSGIKVVEIEYLSAYPESALLQEISDRTEISSAARDVINHNVRRLNHELFGFQDYCIVGEIE